MSAFAPTPFARIDPQSLLEAAPDAMVVSDQEGRIVLVNSHTETLFGYRRDEMLGQRVEMLMPKRFRISHRHYLMAFFDAPRMRPMDEQSDLWGQRKDGTAFPVEISLSPLKVEGRTFVWSAIRDITERKRAEGALRHSAIERGDLIAELRKALDERVQSAAALAANERRLKLAMDAGAVGTYDWDLVTGKIVWDGHQERLFGFEPGGFGGTYANFEERVHPDDLPSLNRAIADARDTRSTFARSFRVVWPDGSIHWILGRGEFLYDESGRPMHMYGAVVDIDERKRTEQALQSAEERFRGALDSMIEGCMLIDFEWRCLYINPAAAQHGFRERGDLIGRSILEVYPGLEQSEIFARFRRAMEERVPQRFEHTFILSSGVTCWYELSVVPVPDGIFVLSLDVTERRQAEAALRKSEERLRQAIRVSGIGIFDHDHASDYIYWSPEQRAMYGWDPDAPVTLPEYLKRVHPEDRERIAAAIRRAHDPKGDGSYDLEHRLVRPEGTVRWTSIRSRTFFEGEGEARHPVRTVGAASDITERKQAEADKARLEAQLSQAQKMESIGRLAGGIAHDFNNLLTVINGYSELLLQRVAANDPTYEPLREIKKAGLRAADLTQQLLSFSRKQAAQPKTLNLNHVVKDVEKMLRRLIGEDIALVTVLSPELGWVMADPGQMTQILMNLAVNSRDAMPDGGRLTIETANVELDERYTSEHPEATAGPYVKLTVSDSGAGMDDETRTHLFEPFFTTKKAGEGTGLGLATVYGAVSQAEGFIRVHSEPGKGTSFRIYLHRVEEEAETQEAASPPARTLQGDETILLVEDQPELRRLARTILRSYGYKVLDAADAEEAMFRSDRWSGTIHLMLTDVVMPGMSGWELANRLKPVRPDMKVIYMSGYTVSATHREIQQVGVDYLQKPLSPEDLLAKVREVLGRSG
jgi:two-component system cell cycle sensor histidine kinase/response regulator CckA